jgi:flagellar motor switch protein FliN
MSEGTLSQEEINALFNKENVKHSLTIDDLLSPMEQDAFGEIGNISIGSCTTALSTLLNQRVDITTPTLSVIEQDRVEETEMAKHVAVHVDYTTGVRGKNLFLIKENDAKIIANLMMGGDGTELDSDLSEMHISAVQEAMNQMMGSAATSMSTMLKLKVDISPPIIEILDFPTKNMDYLDEDVIIQVSFRLRVGNLIDSDMIQLIPLTFGKEMIQRILVGNSAPNSAAVEEVVVQSTHKAEAKMEPAPSYDRREVPTSNTPNTQSNANVQKVEYATITETPANAIQGNINMLYDIPLAITVELGRTEMQIRKILELGPGAVIPLDKLAGEPVDILANQKLIAKGEVVVIEENFGVRITDIISPIDRLNKMTR